MVGANAAVVDAVLGCLAGDEWGQRFAYTLDRSGLALAGSSALPAIPSAPGINIFSGGPPILREFRADTSEVVPGGTITLTWQVDNAEFD